MTTYDLQRNCNACFMNKFPHGLHVQAAHLTSKTSLPILLEQMAYSLHYYVEVEFSISCSNFRQRDAQGMFVYLHLKHWHQSKCWWDLWWKLNHQDKILRQILTCLVIQIWLKHWLLSHTTFLGLPSLSVRWQPLSSLLLFFGLTAVIKDLKNSKQFNCLI